MKREKRNEHQAKRSYLRRVWILGFVTLVCLGILLLRLFFLQVVHFDKYTYRATTNYIDFNPISPMRGAIIDRNGVVLAYNHPTFTLEIVPTEGVDVEQLIVDLSKILPITAQDIQQFEKKRRGIRSKYGESAPLYTGLTQEEVALLSAQMYRFPGAEIKTRLIRTYPLGETASHVLGYVGGITEEDKTRLEESGEWSNYRATQEIGRVGIEASYESLLHGTSGVAFYEITASGRVIRPVREIAPFPGQTIQLTLDIRLQRLIEELFGERRGAAVAIDPRDGEVLALVSKPTFNPNRFIAGFDHETWREMNETPNQPLFHRAIGGGYPIGSTYKPFMALAGMELGIREPKETYLDKDGLYKIGNRSFGSMGGGMGQVDVVKAIARSNNPYFYSLAYEMGIDTIHDFMVPWGFGQIRGIDLGGEIRGVLPSKAWKQLRFQKNPKQGVWYDGETANAGIGQGYNLFTMLQLTSAVATLANHGGQYTPHLLLNSKDLKTSVKTPYQETNAKNIELKEEYLKAVIQGMYEVTQLGSARASFTNAPYLSAGKTGTAQAMSIPQGARYDPKLLKEFQRDHSLYIAFAPLEQPTIALAIIVENSGQGAHAAVPIARRVLDYHVSGLYPSEMDIRSVQKQYARAPQGQPRSITDYDIIAEEEKVALSTIEPQVKNINTWRDMQSAQNEQEGVEK